MADAATSEIVPSPNNETPVTTDSTTQNSSTSQQQPGQAGGLETASTSQQSAASNAAANPPPQQPQPPPPGQPAAVQIDVNQMANVISVSYLAANGLNNQRNRGGGGGVGGVNFGVGAPGQNNIMNMRNRLFHAIYFKVALVYAHIFPKPYQRTLEYFFLIKALLFFSALVYIHMSFIKNPATCLEHVHDWPRDGVLRVEVIPNLDKRLEIYENNQAHENSMRKLQYDYFYGIGPKTKNQLYHHQYATNETYTYYLQHETTYADYLKNKQLNNEYNENNDNDDDDQYIVEYSLEYGHLRLSPATRKRLQIPVRVVQLDPLNNKCFGDKFSKFLLKELLGYDDLLMASVRVIAEQEENKGYLRNVITGEHYRFVSTWWTAWSSYPTAFFVMLLFTFSISMLLRFSHHQIFVFIVDLLQMLEFNVTARFPIAPLLIVILALVGMEAIMSEFFNDTTTAFYIILIVWVADQYDAICCHTSITKRHWLRFFYLYHFAFYAYHYRFSGQNRSLALVSSWLFIQHSMLYFFHHYELPVIMQQAQVLIITRNQNDGNAGGEGGGGGGGAGANIVAGIIQQQQRQQAQQQQQQGQANRNGQQQPGTFMANRIFRLVPLQQQQQQQQPIGGAGQQGVAGGGQVDGLQIQPQQLPFVGGLLQHYAGQNVGGALGMIRRALFARGWRQPIRVRIQTAGNLQRINLGSIQINPENLARVSPTSTPTSTTTADTTPSTTAVATTTITTNAESTGDSFATSSPNATANSSTSTMSVSSCISTTSDVETNQRDEDQNPTSANNTTTTIATTTKETETLENTQTESEGIQQQQQEQKQQLEQPTIQKVTMKNKVAKTSAATFENPANDTKEPDAIGSPGENQVGVCLPLNTKEILKNNSVEDIIVNSHNNTNINCTNNSSNNIKDIANKLPPQPEQQLNVKDENEKPLHATCSKKFVDRELNCLETQKTIENNDEDIKRSCSIKPTNATNNAGGLGCVVSGDTTTTCGDHNTRPAIEAAATAAEPVSTKSTAIQNETKQCDVKPEMIDDETTNKSVTTPASAPSSSASSTGTVEAASASASNQTENSTFLYQCAITAVKDAVNKTNSSRSRSSNTSTGTGTNNSSPITSLNMDISSFEPFTTFATTAATSLANITLDNRNQSENLTENVSAAASSTAPTSTTNLMTSDVPTNTNSTATSSTT